MTPNVSITTFYRWSIWLPILVPAVLIVVVGAFDLRDPVGWVGELVGFSLWIGGLPYCLLAIWAMRWIAGRTETDIRRVMFLAPLLMLAVFVPLALLLGILIGRPGPWAGVAALGGAVIICLGYFYVALTVLLRVCLRSYIAQPTNA